MNDKEKEEWRNDWWNIPTRQWTLNVNAVPDKPGIYFIVITDNLKVKYIGQSQNICKRLKQHKVSGKFDPDKNFIMYSLFSTLNNHDYFEERYRVLDETAYICALNPKENQSNYLTNTIARYVYGERNINYDPCC